MFVAVSFLSLSVHTFCFKQVPTLEHHAHLLERVKRDSLLAPICRFDKIFFFLFSLRSRLFFFFLFFPLNSLAVSLAKASRSTSGFTWCFYVSVTVFILLLFLSLSLISRLPSHPLNIFFHLKATQAIHVCTIECWLVRILWWLFQSSLFSL